MRGVFPGPVLSLPRLRVGWMLALFVSLFPGGMLGGCQGTGDPSAGPFADGEGPIAPSHDQIIFPHANQDVDGATQDRRPLSDEEAGFKEKWELASRYAAGGFDAAALQVIGAALRQKPSAPWGERLHGLKTMLQMRKTEQELLRVDVKPARDYVLFEHPIDLVIRIRNVSAGPLVLLPPQASAAGRAAVSPNAVVLELNRTDRDILASELGRTWTQTLYLQHPEGEPIRIPAGGRFEQRARIPATEVGPPLSGYRTLEIGGTLRSTRMVVDGVERSIRVALRGARVAVVPNGYQPLAEDPIGSMRKALAGVAPVHLLVATEFVPSSLRSEAVEILARALGEGPEILQKAALGALALIRERSLGHPVAPLASPLMDALARWPTRNEVTMRGLRALTGVDLAPDVRLWHDWWRRALAARTSVRAGGP